MFRLRRVHFRFRVRSLMAAVAVVAFVCFGVRVYRDGPWNYWLLLKLRLGGAATRQATCQEIRETDLRVVGRGLFSGLLTGPVPRFGQTLDDAMQRGRRTTDLLGPALLYATHDRDPTCRASAVEALGTLAGFHGSPTLKHETLLRVIALSHDAEPAVRTSAVFELSSAIAGDDVGAVVAALRAALADPSAEVRSAAATGLGSLGVMSPATQPEAVALLAPLLASRDDASVRVKAAWALALFGSDQRTHPPGALPDVVPHLVAALHDRDATVRRAVAQILGLTTVRGGGLISSWAQRKAAIIPALEAAGHDDDDAVRDEAALALFSMGRRDPDILNRLEQAAAKTENRRHYAFEAAVAEMRQDERSADPDDK